jgi:hypothetical protein
MSVKKEAVEAAGKALDALKPEDEVLSAKQAVTRLKSKLMAARSRGIGYDRLANALGEAGVTISADVLRRYMAEFSGSKRTRKAEAGDGSADPRAKAAPARAREERAAGDAPATPPKSSGEGQTPAPWSFPVRPDRKEL